MSQQNVELSSLAEAAFGALNSRWSWHRTEQEALEAEGLPEG